MWQDIAGLIRNRDEDDRLDILEEGTKLVDAALVEAETLFKGMLKTPSPNATLPNKGATLIPDTSPYHSAMTTLFEDVTTNDSRRDRFKCKAAKLKQLEDAVSAGRHPSLMLHAQACLCGAIQNSCMLPASTDPGHTNVATHATGPTSHPNVAPRATRMWHSDTHSCQPIQLDHTNVAPHLTT